MSKYRPTITYDITDDRSWPLWRMGVMSNGSPMLVLGEEAKEACQRHHDTRMEGK